MKETASIHGAWSSNFVFILAATGSAVGLGNIWRFPYVAGENGGGAFVVVYLLCICLIGIPIMMAEVLLGRAGRQSPINTMTQLVRQGGAHPAWVYGVGWLGGLTGILILSYYSVFAGIAMHYIPVMGFMTWSGVDSTAAQEVYEGFIGSAPRVVFWQTLFMVITVLIVSRGVNKGLEQAVKLLMPGLFLLMLAMTGYAMTTGHFLDGLDFLFSFQFEKMSWGGVLEAMGQAFFTLSLGMAAIMAYGAYLPQDARIASTVVTIAGLDTLVAILAGAAIFPVVFANGLEPQQGPGLVFVVLPLAFGNMAAGQLFGLLFFVLLTIAAITSAISLMEPAVAFLVERLKMKRLMAAVTMGVVVWLVGLGSAFSLNIWSDFHLVGSMSFFDFLDYLTNNIMLPLGGALIAVFCGWVLGHRIRREQLALSRDWQYQTWLFLVRLIAPAAVITVLVMNLLG